MTPDPATAAAEPQTRKQLPLWQECLLLLVVALLLALVIKQFFVQAFYIPSPSMEPQFVENDRILVEKISSWGGDEPERGDIVVFRDPGSWLTSVDDRSPSNPVSRMLETIGLYPSGGHLVKRVVGVGGDQIDFCAEKADDCPFPGQLVVNGTPLEEKSYLPEGVEPAIDEFHVIVPEGKLWMMGDNRPNSYDSRGHMGDPGGGYVSVDLVVGKVWSLIWPWKRAEIVDRPQAFEKIPDAR